MKVFATQFVEGLQEASKELKEQGIHISWNQKNRPLNKEELQVFASQNDALITMLCDNIDATFLDQNSHLKIIANYAVGTNNLDVQKAQDLGILLGNTPNVLTHTTAETAITLLLMVSRKINKACKDVSKGNWATWEPTLYNGIDLREKTIGIVGDGRIGKNFAQMAQSLWKSKILIYPHNGRGTDRETFFKEAQIVSFHCPLNNSSKALMNFEFIDKMENPFIFISILGIPIYRDSSINVEYTDICKSQCFARL